MFTQAKSPSSEPSIIATELGVVQNGDSANNLLTYTYNDNYLMQNSFLLYTFSEFPKMSNKSFARGDRTPQEAIFPAAVSQIGRTPLVANNDLLLQTKSILPLPLCQLRHLLCKQLQYITLSYPKTQFFIFKCPKFQK